MEKFDRYCWIAPHRAVPFCTPTHSEDAYSPRAAEQWLLASALSFLTSALPPILSVKQFGINKLVLVVPPYIQAIP